LSPANIPQPQIDTDIFLYLAPEVESRFVAVLKYVLPHPIHKSQTETSHTSIAELDPRRTIRSTIRRCTSGNEAVLAEQAPVDISMETEFSIAFITFQALHQERLPTE
jgi:hypothetical protein